MAQAGIAKTGESRRVRLIDVVRGMAGIRANAGRLLLVLAALSLAACGGGGGDGNTSSGGGASGTTTLSVSGGTTNLGDVQIQHRQGALLKQIGISSSDVSLPEPLPAGLRAVKSKNIGVSQADQDMINAPLKVQMKYDDSGLANEEDLLVLHHLRTGGYEPVRILSHDTTANTITFESRSFSEFVLAIIDAALPASFDSQFRAGTNGWNIANFGSYFAPNGNCLGMSAFAVWNFNQASRPALRTLYTANIARLVAIRAHMAQSQTWAIGEWRGEQVLGSARIGRLMKAYMSLLGKPLILLLGTNGNPAHASVVYGYDATGFKFYDVNSPNLAQSVTFNGTNFGTYQTYNTFGFVGLPSMGRTEDFAQLASEAAGGFTTSQNIQITQPIAGQTVSTRSATLAGSLTGGLNPLTKLYAEVKGVGREIPVASGTFRDTIEVSNGTNTIVLLAGVDIANQSNWYKNAATLIHEINGNLPNSALFITLGWEQAGTDVDLYVTNPQGQTVYYASRSSGGLTLDFDDTDGFGPEHVTLDSSASIQPGDYRVRVHYYRTDGGVAATGKVHMVVNEGQDNQRAKEVRFSIPTANASNAAPGSSGADWVDVGRINILNSTIQ